MVTLAATMEDFPITTSLAGAAREISKHSFAIYKAPVGTANAIQDAWNEAVPVLNAEDPPSTNCQRIVQGHLHGYNVPSRSKRLFRAFCGSPEQPWPNPRFQQTSLQVADHLHQALAECYHHLERIESIQTPSNPSSEAYPQHSGMESSSLPLSTLESENQSPARKRARLSRTHSKNLKMPLTAQDTSACPLDYFLYHNQDPSAVNCSKHVDRGLLIAVCLTDVPGLELLVSPEKQWVTPEVWIHNAHLYQETESACSSGWICILAGGQLSQRMNIAPCVHRVRQPLKRARLSISYELRV
jgi:hypothetical protein